MTRKDNDLSEYGRIIIEKIWPEIDDGKFPIKRIPGENVVVRADIFTYGHDDITAVLLYRTKKEDIWHEIRMAPLGNDRWIAAFGIEDEVDYFYTVRGHINEFRLWCKDLEKKIKASQDVSVDLKIGAQIIEKVAKSAIQQDAKQLRIWAQKLTEADDPESLLLVAMRKELFDMIEANLNKKDGVMYDKQLRVSVERKLSAFSSWYEFFPRSWSDTPGQHGTFKDCERLLPEISRMGFDIIYLPPIHPIGKTNRKGKNNSTVCGHGDPGSPWAIGGKEGGHKAIHSQLGTIKEFKDFVKKAKGYDIEVALDLAFQCSPDHPYVKEHPDWFKYRPDGTIQYAENPPKKYEDIVPINFNTEDWRNLWEELKSVVLFWAEQKIRIFRVDNPHTKPFLFWEWLITEVKHKYPNTIFLSEAFTRPKVMYRLAKCGFSQSYTYFTWRNTKKEFTEYMTELTQGEVAEYFRPNFWPNTPDILPEHLQYEGRPAFITRVVLAATLSSNFGIYGPAFELCVAEAITNKEEYLNSEKYEIKRWDWNKEGHLKDILARLNKIRKENPSLHMTRNIRFCQIGNDNLLCYYKATGDFSNIILVVVNLDPYHTQSGCLQMPLDELGIDKGKSYLAHDLLTGDKYVWQGETSYIELNPNNSPAHILKIHRQLCREQDFDYFL